MALMFQRLANNFAKNGYYPTDADTTQRILNIIAPCEKGEMRILDPCAGEGVVLAECKTHLGAERTVAYGIEYDEDRAWHAKTLLNTCIHGDIQHCVIEPRQFGLLFLNPPYGDLVSDQALTGFVQKGRPRLEKLFYQRTLSSLQWDGILVLIIPHYSLDAEFSYWLSHSFTDVTAFMAPEERYKQVVIIGKRCRAGQSKTAKSVQGMLERIGQGELPPTLPDEWNQEPYTVPAMVSNTVKFYSARLDNRQLAACIELESTLWQQFDACFAQVDIVTRRSLMPLSQWHLALSLAAGQVSGLVTAKDGRLYLIKGDTYKEVTTTTVVEEPDTDEAVEVETQTDRFVPIIRAIDMTPNSQTLGHVLTIR